MKSIIRKTGLLFIIFILVINSCKKEEVPLLTTAAIINILGTSATSGGTITSEGSETVLSRGVCWSTLATPTIADSKTQDGAGAGSFTSSLIELNGATVYYVRAYATNSVGTGYGMAISFTTLGQVPAPTNSAATNITATSATINGTVNPNYLSTIVSFEYGTTTSYGSPVTATQSPITGNANTNVSADITALTPGTTYHYRVKAVNSLGTTYSDDITFTTLGQVPTVTTLAATNTNISSATLNGSVNANYLSTDVTFEYGTTTNYGSTASATQTPVTGNTITNASVSITGLFEGTIYHFRVKAVNSLGTSYGSDMTFTTTPSTTVTDVDGNIYNKVTIGTQVWMKENLKTTKYNDGTAIPNITDDSTWAKLTTGAYSDYNNTPSNSIIYGRLYNWYTADNNAATKVASNGGKNVCPTGWHIPADAEWTTLTDYLTNNGYGYEGSGSDIAKSMAATSGWNTDPTAGNVGNDQASNNSSGFTALPSGGRNDAFPRAGHFGPFGSVGNFGLWWSSTEYSSVSAYYRGMSFNGSLVSRDATSKRYGYSVRCLKDN